MTRQLIALAVSVLTVVAMWVIGNHDWRGWALGLVNQALWLAFIVAFGAWGLLPLSAFLVVTYTRNLVKWRREVRAIESTAVLAVELDLEMRTRGRHG